MQEALEAAKQFHENPNLFPWVVLALIVLFIVSQRKLIVEYMESRITEHNAKALWYENQTKSSEVTAEVIRNNTAALNNNTEALYTSNQDRGETRRMLDKHEELSKERDRHIQEVVNRIDETVSRNSLKLGLIEDRTDH